MALLMAFFAALPAFAQDASKPKDDAPVAQAKNDQDKDEPKAKQEDADDPVLIPLPVLMFSENEGYGFGGGVAIIPSTENGEIETLYIPSIFYQKETHFNFFMDYFNSRGEYQHEEIQAYVATRSDRFFHFNYEDHKLKDVDFVDGFEADLHHGVEGQSFFYGFGNGVDDEPAPNYKSISTDVSFLGVWNIGDDDDLKVIAGPIFNDTTIHTGIISSRGKITKIKTAFPGLPGARSGSGHVGVRASLVYDTRDIELVPRSGSYVEATADFNQKVRGEGGANYGRFTIDTAHYFDFDEDVSMAVRGVMEAVTRSSRMPFYLRPELGGLENLRAFDDGRWRDFYSWDINWELRIKIADIDVGVPLEVEMGPLLDIGSVFNSFGYDMVTQVNVNPGFHVRLLNRPNVSMGLFVAYGRDGIEAHLGFGIPF